MHVLKKLKARGRDFVAVFICASVNFQPANFLMHRHKENLKKCNFDNKFLIDIPRDDTIQAFMEADIFAFPSQVEVAPLVALEAMASKIPWVSLNVGNMKQLKGGFIVEGMKKMGGRLLYNSNMYEEFSQYLDDLLINEDLRREKSEENLNRVRDQRDEARGSQLDEGVKELETARREQEDFQSGDVELPGMIW